MSEQEMPAIDTSDLPEEMRRQIAENMASTAAAAEIREEDLEGEYKELMNGEETKPAKPSRAPANRSAAVAPDAPTEQADDTANDADLDKLLNEGDQGEETDKGASKKPKAPAAAPKQRQATRPKAAPRDQAASPAQALNEKPIGEITQYDQLFNYFSRTAYSYILNSDKAGFDKFYKRAMDMLPTVVKGPNAPVQKVDEYITFGDCPAYATWINFSKKKIPETTHQSRQGSNITATIKSQLEKLNAACERAASGNNTVAVQQIRRAIHLTEETQLSPPAYLVKDYLSYDIEQTDNSITAKQISLKVTSVVGMNITGFYRFHFVLPEGTVIETEVIRGDKPQWGQVLIASTFNAEEAKTKFGDLKASVITQQAPTNTAFSRKAVDSQTTEFSVSGLKESNQIVCSLPIGNGTLTFAIVIHSPLNGDVHVHVEEEIYVSPTALYRQTSQELGTRPYFPESKN